MSNLNIFDLVFTVANCCNVYPYRFWVDDKVWLVIDSSDGSTRHFRCFLVLCAIGSLLHFLFVLCFWIFIDRFRIEIGFYLGFCSKNSYLMDTVMILYLLCKTYLFFQAFYCFLILFFSHARLFFIEIRVLTVLAMIFDNSIWNMNAPIYYLDVRF